MKSHAKWLPFCVADRAKSDSKAQTEEWRSLTINEQGEQVLLFSAISGFASEAGLRTLLECLELTREQPRFPSHYHKAWDPEQEVILLVTSPWRASEAPERWRRWEQALESHVARSPELSERQQRFLRDLRKALARQIQQQ